MFSFVKFIVVICIMFFGNDYGANHNHIHERKNSQIIENNSGYEKTVTSDYLIIENEEGIYEQILICSTPSIEPKVIVPICLGIRIYLSGIDSTGHSTNGVTVNIDGDYISATYVLSKNGQSVNGNFASGATFFITGTYSLSVKCICGEYFYKSFTINELSLVVDESDALVEHNGVTTNQDIVSVTNTFTYEMNSTVGTINSRFVAHSLNPAIYFDYYYMFTFCKYAFRLSLDNPYINLNYSLDYDLVCGVELINSSTVEYDAIIDYSDGQDSLISVNSNNCYLNLDLDLKYSETIANGGYEIVYKNAIVDITFQLESVAVAGDLYGTIIPIDGNYHYEFDYDIWMIKWGQATSQLEEFCIEYYGMFAEVVDIIVGIESGPIASGIYNVSRRICASFLESSNIVYPTNYIDDSLQVNMHFEYNVSV